MDSEGEAMGSRIMYGAQKDTGLVTPCRAKDPSTCPYHADGSHVQLTAQEAEAYNEKVAASNAASPKLSKTRGAGRNVVAAVMDSADAARDVDRIRGSLQALREANVEKANAWLRDDFGYAAPAIKSGHNDAVKDGSAPAGLYRLITTVDLTQGYEGDPGASIVMANMGPENPIKPADPKVEGGFVTASIADELGDRQSSFSANNPAMRLVVSGNALKTDGGSYAQKIYVTPSKPGEVAQGTMMEYVHLTGKRPLCKLEKTSSDPDMDESTRLSILDQTDPSRDVLTVVDSLDDGRRTIKANVHPHGDLATTLSSTATVTLEPSGDEAYDIWETARRVDSMTREALA